MLRFKFIPATMAAMIAFSAGADSAATGEHENVGEIAAALAAKVSPAQAITTAEQQTGSRAASPTTIQPTGRADNNEYNQTIDPADFVAVINNPFYTLIPGSISTYQGATAKGIEKNIVTVTHETKNILGVTATVVWDREWLNDALIEETYDWYAQDKEGNVWYLGEDSKEYENGKAVNSKGSWEAGVDGAKPGIIMKGDPKIGDSYRQEYLKGQAEDMADVVALNESVTVPFGTFRDCLKTRDWSKIEPSANEYKYYCAKVGGVVLEEDIGNGEKVELINVQQRGE